MIDNRNELFFFKNKVCFTDQRSALASITIKTHDTVSLTMSNGEKLTFCERDKPRFVNEETKEVVVEYSGLATDGNEERSWSIAYFSEGACSPKHHHEERTETYYITAGEANLVIDDQEYALKAGDTMTITPRQKHQIFNVGSDKLVLIVQCTPAWVASDCYFEQTHRPQPLR